MGEGVSPFGEAFKEALRPRDTRTVIQWGVDNIRYIPNSARSNSGFQPDATPWLKEPLEFWGVETVKEQVLILPTGAGKTTFFDVCIPHCIAENPGDILLSMQTKDDVRGHIETRLMPTLKACPPVRKIFDSLERHKLKRDTFVLPHMTVHTAGESKNDYQRISVRYVLIDEAWLLKHGYMGEARARLHDRWDGRTVIVSQGGEQHLILAAERRERELFSAWKQTDCRVWSMVCPECGEVAPWKMPGIIYADSSDDREVIESARYFCQTCETKFEDRLEIRRALSGASRYEITNPNGMPNHHGWTAAGPGLFHITWGELALGWKKANEAKRGGDLEPLKIFIQKRLAQFWKEEEDAPDVILGASGYQIEAHADGSLIESEAYRFATIDRQNDHFWAEVRAWRADGFSRLLYFDKLPTVEACRAVQLQYRVKDDFTGEDARHMPSEVYEDCARFGWVALFGDDIDGYDHHPRAGGKPVKKFYSPLKKAMSPSGKVVRYLRWSNEKVKDILFSFCAGRGPGFQVPDDIDNPALPENERYHRQIRAEVKRDVVKKGSTKIARRYVRTRRHNHAIDTEAENIVFALIKGVVADMAQIPEDEPNPEDQKEPEQ